MKDNTWVFKYGNWTCKLSSYEKWFPHNNFYCPECKNLLIKNNSAMIENDFQWTDTKRDSYYMAGLCLNCQSKLIFMR